MWSSRSEKKIGAAMECRSVTPMLGVDGGRIQRRSLEEEKERRKGLTGFAFAARRGLHGEPAMDCVPG